MGKRHDGAAAFWMDVRVLKTTTLVAGAMDRTSG